MIIPRSTTLGAEGRRPRKVLVVLGLVLIVGNLTAFIVGGLVRGETVAGPPGSSYVTTAFGSAALAELIESEGDGVERLRAPYTTSRLDPTETLLLIEVGLSSFSEAEAAIVGQYLRDGGRLVLAGPDPDRIVASTGKGADEVPAWEPGGPAIAIGTHLDVGEVPLSGRGQFGSSNGATPILEGDEGEVVGVEWTVGRGVFVWLADSTPLQNTGLAGGDSAGLAMTLTGGRDVVFDEFRHGYGGDTFWQLLPDGWVGAIALLTFAAGAWVLAYGRRLGPPEDTERKLQPERAAYVESVAAILGRTGPAREAIDPVRARVRRLLANRAGLGPEATEDELRKAAHDAGVDPGDMEAVLDPLGDPVPAGRALAHISARR